MIDWNIQSRAHDCQACAGPFTDRQPYHTLLFDAKGHPMILFESEWPMKWTIDHEKSLTFHEFAP